MGTLVDRATPSSRAGAAAVVVVLDPLGATLDCGCPDCAAVAALLRRPTHQAPGPLRVARVSGLAALPDRLVAYASPPSE